MEDEIPRKHTSRNPDNYELKIEGLLGAFKSERVRWLTSRETDIKRNSGISDEAFKRLFETVVKQEAERSLIISVLNKKKEAAIGEIATSTEIPQKDILKHIIALIKRGSVAVTGERTGEYLFMALEPPQ